MFEQFTEKARRVIFFARYEASGFGSPYIEAEHLLLGLIREDPLLRGQLSPMVDAAGAIRQEITSLRPVREKISTSVDLPLSQESKLVLVEADMERKALGQDATDCGHLVLGLLRTEGSLAAELLTKYGIDYQTYREIVRDSRPTEHRGIVFSPEASSQPSRRLTSWVGMDEPRKTAAPSLDGAVSRLTGILEVAIAHLEYYSEQYGRQKLKRKPWSRTEALGHLIDYATAHHQCFARALTESKLFIASMPKEEWIPAQHYADCPWTDVVDLWVSLNSLLIHVLGVIPEEKVNISCRIGIEEPITLLKLVERYVAHCEDLVGQISSRLA